MVRQDQYQLDLATQNAELETMDKISALLLSVDTLHNPCQGSIRAKPPFDSLHLASLGGNSGCNALHPRVGHNIARTTDKLGYTMSNDAFSLSDSAIVPLSFAASRDLLISSKHSENLKGHLILSPGLFSILGRICGCFEPGDSGLCVNL